MALTPSQIDDIVKEACEARSHLEAYARRVVFRRARLREVDADDLVQEALVRLRSQLEEPDAVPPGSVVAYVKKTITNYANDVVKRDTRLEQLPGDDRKPDLPADGGPTNPQPGAHSWRPGPSRTRGAGETTEDEDPEEVWRRAAAQLAERFRGLTATVRDGAPPPPEAEHLVDYHAVLLLELRLSLAPACGGEYDNDLEDIADVVEKLLPWLPEEAARAFKQHWPRIEQLWSDARPVVRRPPSRVDCATLCRAVNDRMGGSALSAPQWYQWTRRARKAARKRVGPRCYDELLSPLLGKVEDTP